MADTQTLTQSRRRRAACAVLDGVLGDDDLLDALWMQHDGMHGDAVSDIIRYIDAVATRHLLDAATRKRLYEALHAALRRSDAELPIDPWPAMLARRPAGAGPATLPAQRPLAPPAWGATADPGAATAPALAQGLNPAQSLSPAWTGAMAAAMSAPPAAAVAPPSLASATGPTGAAGAATPAAPTAEPGWTPDSTTPAEQFVFASLIDAMAGELAQTHAAAFEDWRSGWQAVLQAQKKFAPELRQRMRDACTALAPEQPASARIASWLLPLTARQLAEQVHQVYVVLCEALGPVGADQVLTRAVKRVEASPAARVFSPRKLI
ncbi:MAG: hypothetical protein RIQ60_1292 [Pseudomonadota bacterium]|jgi:hypothetical protein